MKFFGSAILFIMILTSCSSIQSGKYIQIRKGDSLASLAKEFDIPKDKLTHVNPGSSFKEGQWVLIPLAHGVLGHGKYYDSFKTLEMIESGKMQWPVPASKRVSSHFGKRWGKKHEGLDIAARSGSHIVAAENGVVVYSGSEMGGYGNIIVLSHGNGIFTVYAHNKKNFVSKGQTISRGQVIGQVGSTGRSSGPHLHFEVRHNSRPLNPKRFLTLK